MRPTYAHHLRASMLFTLFLGLACIAFAQSEPLGDRARENRDRKAADQTSGTPPKVITNANLPKDPDVITTSEAESGEQQQNPQAAAPTRASQERAAQQRAAAQWKRRILQQENIVANLRVRVDRLKAAIRFADPNYSVNGSSPDYYASQSYNRPQTQRLDRLAKLQLQLGMQKQKLEELQESARHAGMHATVYDP
jgi:hypothetical protein